MAGSIFTGKEGYNVAESFKVRTDRVLIKGHQGLRKNDLEDLPADNPAVRWIRESLAAQMTETNTKPAGRVLDVGCGYGRWYKHLRDFCANFYGVDANADRIAFAQQRYHNERAYFGTLPLGPSFPTQYDTILCINVLQHLTLNDAPELILFMSEHLKDEGRMYLWEGKILPKGGIEEAEAEYAKGNCPAHMIPKPLSYLEAIDPTLQWTPCAWHGAAFIVTRKSPEEVERETIPEGNLDADSRPEDAAARADTGDRVLPSESTAWPR